MYYYSHFQWGNRGTLPMNAWPEAAKQGVEHWPLVLFYAHFLTYTASPPGWTSHSDSLLIKWTRHILKPILLRRNAQSFAITAFLMNEVERALEPREKLCLFLKTTPSYSMTLELFLKMPRPRLPKRAIILLQNRNQISSEIKALLSLSRIEGQSWIWSEVLYCFLLI